MNYGTDLKYTKDNFHVIIERADFEKTLQYIKVSQPMAKNLFIVNDSSTTGQIVKSQLVQILAEKFPEFQPHWVENISISEFESTFSKLDNNDAILFTIYQTNGKNQVYQYNEALKELLLYSKVPVWCTWSFSMNTGVIGGCLASGNKQGERAAQSAYEILSGESATNIIYDTSSLNATYIDYEVMIKYNIEESVFPSNTIFLNKPVNYFEKNREIITFFGIILIIMSIVIAILLRLIYDQKVIHKQHIELLDLKNSIISTQSEMVFRMSELIETRSHSTGNHVRRVALISRIIGSKAGLSNEQLDSLEAASPMHDIGKIGIPESILGKPAKLTDEERKIIKAHSQIGSKIFQDTDLPLFVIAGKIAQQHHENWDGSGYPLGISGDEIDILSRIVSIADVFDALLTKREYKEGWSFEETVSYINSQSGIKFDPALVSHFIESIPQIRDIYSIYKN